MTETCYIAIQHPDFHPETALALTPSMMSWDDHCWILDLTPCLSYWRQRACRADLMDTSPYASALAVRNTPDPSPSADVIVRHLLDHAYPHSLNSHAAVSRDPWRAVLLAAAMKERNLTGWMDGDGRLGRNIYRSMSWEIWQQEVRRLLEILASRGHTKSPLQKARQQLSQLQQMADRLALATPHDLPKVSHDSFRRRYGDFLADIWQQSFGDGDLRTDFFPWRSHTFFAPPQRQRHLDFPIAQWELMVPLLREDLFLLCSMGCLPEQHRVLLLTWDIVLDDMSRVSVPVLFRHPHDLLSESPHFNTALLQAHYAFQGALNRICGRERPSSPCLQAVVSWQLEISHMWQAPPQIVDIFGTRHTAYDALAELENRLAVPLLGYEHSNQWQPEDSYCEMASPPTGATHFAVTTKTRGRAKPGSPHDGMPQTGIPLTLLALARHRPLFLHKKPIALTQGAWRGKPRFLERVMGKWWVLPRERQAPRDYYLARDNQRRLLWIYKDGFGQWYEHGLFH